MTNTSLLILEPPYVIARRHRGVLPSLGAVALLDATSARLRSTYIKSEMDNAPWCPLCLLAAPTSGMRSTRRLARTCIVFGLNDQDASAAILRAVSARPRPTPSDIADWIVSRTRLPMLSRTLVELFNGPEVREDDVRHMPFKVRQQLQQLGDYSGRTWQRVADLADLAADRSLLNRTLSGDDMASAERRASIPELLGVTYREFHQRYGWEWVLEAALRRSGFFERDTRRIPILRPTESTAWQHPALAPLMSA